MQEDAVNNAASAGSTSDAQAPAEAASARKASGLHDSVFDQFVHQEEDVVGLLAFSLSMQNKRDWLTAFNKEVGRDPNAAELVAFDIGERIDRRLVTYRKLAENALSGNVFWASTSLTPVSELPGTPMAEHATPLALKSSARASRLGSALAVVAGLVVAVAAIAYASRHYWGT